MSVIPLKHLLSEYWQNYFAYSTRIVQQIGFVVKAVKERNDGIIHSCIKGRLGIVGGLIGIIPGNDHKCLKCIVEQNSPIFCRYSPEYIAATQTTTAKRETGTMVAVGNVFAAKEVKLELFKIFNSDPSKL